MCTAELCGVSETQSAPDTPLVLREAAENSEWELQCCRHTALQNWTSGKVRNYNWWHTQTTDCLLGLLTPFWLNFKIQNPVPALSSPTFPHLAQWTPFPFHTISATASPTDTCPRTGFYPSKCRSWSPGLHAFFIHDTHICITQWIEDSWNWIILKVPFNPNHSLTLNSECSFLSQTPDKVL